ncbi:hypothetical protein BD779DRAFT_317938 [Infundibulicybe gibba]|nr:hypothetical protein BD779DRAFT_317938 [Infundibulicybe gibba]
MGMGYLRFPICSPRGRVRRKFRHRLRRRLCALCGSDIWLPAIITTRFKSAPKPRPLFYMASASIYRLSYDAPSRLSLSLPRSLAALRRFGINRSCFTSFTGSTSRILFYILSVSPAPYHATRTSLKPYTRDYCKTLLPHALSYSYMQCLDLISEIRGCPPRA